MTGNIGMIGIHRAGYEISNYPFRKPTTICALKMCCKVYQEQNICTLPNRLKCDERMQDFIIIHQCSNDLSTGYLHTCNILDTDWPLINLYIYIYIYVCVCVFMYII